MNFSLITHYYSMLPEPLLSLMNNTPKKGIILDAGCGDGSYSSSLHSEKRKIVSLDITSPKNPFDAENSFVLGSIEFLPFKNNVFDFVYCFSVIQLIDDDQSAFREIHRILKSSGRFLFTIPTYWSLFMIIRKLEIFFGTYEYQQYNVRHYHYYTRPQIKNLVHSLFRVIQISGYDYNFFSRFLHFIGNLSGIKTNLHKKISRECVNADNGDTRKKLSVMKKMYLKIAKKALPIFRNIIKDNQYMSNFAYHYIIILSKE